MGAPSGHPFFGNQYTDGGYVPGSYFYVADVTGSIVSDVSQRSVPIARELFKKSAGSKPEVLIVGGLVLLIGAAIFAVERGVRRRVVGGQSAVGDDRSGRGRCESCDQSLPGADLSPAQVDNEGDYVKCTHCRRRNYAKYDDE